MQNLVLLLALYSPPFDMAAERAKSQRIVDTSYIFEGVTRKITIDKTTVSSPNPSHLSADVTLEVEVKDSLTAWKPPQATMKFRLTGNDFDFDHLKKSLQDKPFLFLARGDTGDRNNPILVPSYNFYLLEKIGAQADKEEWTRQLLRPKEIASGNWTRLKWLSNALSEIETAKAGQTLADIDRFANRGAIGTDWTVMYTHRLFPFLAFTVQIPPERANKPRGTISPDEVVKSVSKPWLQWPRQ